MQEVDRFRGLMNVLSGENTARNTENQFVNKRERQLCFCMISAERLEVLALGGGAMRTGSGQSCPGGSHVGGEVLHRIEYGWPRGIFREIFSKSEEGNYGVAERGNGVNEMAEELICPRSALSGGSEGESS